MTQEEFNKAFISVKEIATFVGVTVTAVWYARNEGKLPAGITVANTRVILWPREEIVPLIIDWKAAIDAKESWKKQSN